MQKPKLLKLPKKPKRTATNAVLQNYFARVNEVNAANAGKIKAYHDYKKEHAKLVSGLGNVKHTVWKDVPAYDRKPTVKAYKRSSVVRKAARRVKGVGKVTIRRYPTNKDYWEVMQNGVSKGRHLQKTEAKRQAAAIKKVAKSRAKNKR